MIFKDWLQCTFKKKVILRTLSNSDDPSYRHILKEELIDKSELPPEAVRCRGEPHYWSLNLIDEKNDGRDPYGYSAHDAHSFLHTDAFDNLLSGVWKLGDHVNLVKILSIVGIAIVAVVIFYVFFGKG